MGFPPQTIIGIIKNDGDFQKKKRSRFPEIWDFGNDPKILILRYDSDILPLYS